MPTYEFTCVLCGDFTLWRSIHAEPLDACPTCGNVVAKIISIPMLHGVGERGKETLRVDGTEKQWDRDMPAYKRLRDAGHQPQRITGADKLEATALGDWHIKTGQAHPDDKVHAAQEQAQQIIRDAARAK